MKRARRHKLVQVSIFFIIYSIIIVYSKETKSEVTDKTEIKSTAATALSSTTQSSNGPSKPTTVLPTTRPTLRPKRNCTPPAIEQFPKPLMGPWGRKHGGIILHMLVAVYTFLGLAIVCDEYFVSSLDRICEELKLSPDVAGATFMAAGSSAPELATVVIGVFFAQDDIGISGVIGSAVFNIMFVISVCALSAGTVCYLNWWPLVRDCFFYAVSILVMLSTIYDDFITWGESLFMLFMYVIYCMVLHFNPQLERWAQKLPVPCRKPLPDEESGLVSYKTLDEEKKHTTYGSSPDRVMNNEEQDFGGNLSGPVLNQGFVPSPVGPTTAAQQGYYKPKDYNATNRVDPLVKPENQSLLVRVPWAIVYPIHFMCKKTTPDCRTEQYKNWYPFTFLVSMIWISFYSYFMVWMITIIGTTLEIPDTVMGLTFVAAGVSVPDALSSIAVIKEGYGDMAVSNAVGSNVFDILICLGLPWFIQTAIIKPGSHVNVISKGLTYSTLSLLSTVVFLIVATHLNGWKLDRKYGIILMIWYLLFITFASLYELNIFGDVNPAECPSIY